MRAKYSCTCGQDFNFSFFDKYKVALFGGRCKNCHRKVVASYDNLFLLIISLLVPAYFVCEVLQILPFSPFLVAYRISGSMLASWLFSVIFFCVVVSIPGTLFANLRTKE